jgi:hypothetical protein
MVSPLAAIRARLKTACSRVLVSRSSHVVTSRARALAFRSSRSGGASQLIAFTARNIQ